MSKDVVILLSSFVSISFNFSTDGRFVLVNSFSDVSNRMSILKKAIDCVSLLAGNVFHIFVFFDEGTK
jgi:hypothetical protein